MANTILIVGKENVRVIWKTSLSITKKCRLLGTSSNITLPYLSGHVKLIIIRNNDYC